MFHSAEKSVVTKKKIEQREREKSYVIISMYTTVWLELEKNVG